MKFLTYFFGILLIVIGVFAIAYEYIPGVSSTIQSLQTNLNFPQIPISNNGRVRVVSEESVVIDVVKKVGPSVVTIALETNREPVDDDIFFFFGFPRPEDENDEPQNIGSGFILSDDGLIVTNKHVVSNPQTTYSIITYEEVNYQITQIYRDPLNDIAIIKIDPNEHPGTNLPAVTLGDSDNLQVGQLAIAIGTPLGEFNNSVTKGIVSGLGRGIVAGSPFEGFVERLDNVIQTDAAISPGNSGGPLLDSQGRVIGINTAVSQGGENIGFALPINLVKEAIQIFEETGRFDRPYLGVTYRMLSRELALQNDVPEGALVQSVIDNSPADQAGIEIGDIILRVGNIRITERDRDLAQVISENDVGEEITVQVWRETGSGESEEINVDVTLGNATEQ